MLFDNNSVLGTFFFIFLFSESLLLFDFEDDDGLFLLLQLLVVVHVDDVDVVDDELVVKINKCVMVLNRIGHMLNSNFRILH